MFTKESFYTKLQQSQNQSQKYNAIVEDICILYIHFFPKQEQFTSEELWEFLFTNQPNHLTYHVKIWNTFELKEYNYFFSIIYKALDDPPSLWWKTILKENLNNKTSSE